MFRFDKAGKLFYMGFTIKKYQKEHTPVEVSVDVINRDELSFMDYGKNNPEGFEKQVIDVKVEVTARLKDEEHMEDPLARAVYYTREDRERWEITLNGKAAMIDDIQVFDNMAKTTFVIPMTKGQVKALTGQDVLFRATARCIYFDGRYDEGSSQCRADFSIEEYITEEEPPFLMEPECVIPQTGFDIVKFCAYDGTDMTGIAERRVLINGNKVDDEFFFSGNYIFGDGQDGLKKIDVYYTDHKGNTAIHSTWAYIRHQAHSTVQIFRHIQAEQEADSYGYLHLAGCDIVNSAYPINPGRGRSGASAGFVQKKDVSRYAEGPVQDTRLMKWSLP